ncbi:MAG: histidine triad nucleotide-binding protein [Oscillospiraceae bacterium]|nr:histidine triad nucleotide-binding protein [Oscillospiraceae bacterium]
MDNCLFCKIIKGEIPSDKVYEDDLCYAFKDINPVAPIHVLVIPKEHIASCGEITSENSAATAHIFEVISKLAKELDLKDGFRVVSNCGEAAGQTVFHLHFHLLGGRQFGWPEG